MANATAAVDPNTIAPDTGKPMSKSTFYRFCIGFIIFGVMWMMSGTIGSAVLLPAALQRPVPRQLRGRPRLHAGCGQHLRTHLQPCLRRPLRCVPFAFWPPLALDRHRRHLYRCGLLVHLGADDRLGYRHRLVRAPSRSELHARARRGRPFRPRAPEPPRQPSPPSTAPAPPAVSPSAPSSVPPSSPTPSPGFLFGTVSGSSRASSCSLSGRARSPLRTRPRVRPSASCACSRASCRPPRTAATSMLPSSAACSSSSVTSSSPATSFTSFSATSVLTTSTPPRCSPPCRSSSWSCRS